PEAFISFEARPSMETPSSNPYPDDKYYLFYRKLIFNNSGPCLKAKLPCRLTGKQPVFKVFKPAQHLTGATLCPGLTRRLFIDIYKECIGKTI
ncbi:MAG: hypothetical protein ACQETG_10115, partial [Thermodesulfobacteriota bacterium]